MMKNILIIIAFLFLYSCNKQENNLFTRDEVKSFTSGVPEIPLFNNTNIMFVKVEEDKIGSTYVGYLYYIYKSKSLNSYENFEDFLFNALNQMIIFKETDFKGGDEVVFSLQKDIEKEYEKFGLDILLQKHFKKNVNVYNANSTNISTETLFTLLYLFYINEYEIYFDDPSGFYTVIPPTTSTKE